MVVNETTKVLDEEEEKMKLIQERLKKDGNWWTYTRGFSVRISLFSLSSFLSHVNGYSRLGLGFSVF